MAATTLLSRLCNASKYLYKFEDKFFAPRFLIGSGTGIAYGTYKYCSISKEAFDGYSNGEIATNYILYVGGYYGLLIGGVCSIAPLITIPALGVVGYIRNKEPSKTKN